MEENKITLKQVLNKIKNMDDTHKFEWLYSLLKEFGSEITSELYHKGYEQGKFDNAMENSTPKEEIPDYVGYWLEYCKATNVGMINAMYVWNVTLHNYARMSDADKLRAYFLSNENQETFLTAWVNGYKVKKEKYYCVAVPVGHGLYKRVVVYSDYTLGLGDHNYVSLAKLEQHSRQSTTKITEEMIKESPLSWAWQFATELED
jgi:hypothetical protein